MGMLSPVAVDLMTAMEAPRYSLFFLMQTVTGPVRAWLGIGDYDLPPCDVDPDGGVYLGIGLVGNIPTLRQLIGGLAERVDFTLNGADERTLRLSDQDAHLIRNAPVFVGIVFFDDHWQPVFDVVWPWSGTADVVDVDRSGDGEDIVRKVILSVGSGFTDRTRPPMGFYTDADQRRRSPDDTFCARVSVYTVESTIVWPAPG